MDKKYLAGFVDGEGWIGILRKKNLSVRGHIPQYLTGISITNTNKHILELIQAKYGGFVRERKVVGNRKRSYILEMVGKRNSDLILKDITPYLIIKNEQAQIAVKFNKDVQKKYSRARDLSVDVWEERKKMYEKCRELNHRGIDKLVIDELDYKRPDDKT